MSELLLFTHVDNQHLITVYWLVGILLFFVLLLGIFFQRRTSIRLRNELAELAKVRQNNIEYEFLLKAMKIAVWHIDPVMRTLTVDSDFRDVSSNVSAAENISLELIYEMYDKNDRIRVMRALDDICAGRSNYYHEQYRVCVSHDSSGVMYWEESFATISVRDEEGNPQKIIGTSLRIDKQKQMEANLIIFY